MARLRLLALTAWIAAFLAAAANHLHDFANRGPRPYAGMPLGVEAFWTSLVLVDPIVAVLLLRVRRAGLVAGVAVMLVDVAVNTSVALTSPQDASSPNLLMQAGFLGFTLGSIAWLWPARGGVTALR